jgi:hypothetical protein
LYEKTFPCANRSRVDLMTYFGSLELDNIKKKNLNFEKKTLQNGEEIQDFRKTRLFHNSVNFHLNHLKTSIHKKSLQNKLFFKTSR